MVCRPETKRTVALLLVAAVVTSCGDGGEPLDQSSSEDLQWSTSDNSPADLRPAPTAEPAEVTPGTVPSPDPTGEPIDF